MRLFNMLNTPAAVVVMLAIILVANGFLFYRYKENLESSVTTPPASEQQYEGDLTTSP